VREGRESAIGQACEHRSQNNREVVSIEYQHNLCTLKHMEGEMSQHNISITQFGSLEVYTEQEQTVRLAHFWSAGVAVFVFVRHFG
jgi:hypothetical protein